jgi:hypothetical protein
VVRFIRLVLFIVLVMMPLIVEAQTYETNLTGTVAGPNGAPISNVQVKVVNLGTNAIRTTKTGDSGSYYVGNLPIGRYSLTVSAENFSTQKIADIQLVVGQVRQINVKMKLGTVSQEVRVVDTAPP